MIDTILDRFASVMVWFTETLPSWWRATFPKWFRFIFFYATIIVWGPVIAIIAFIAWVIFKVGTGVYEIWNDFDD